MSKSLSILALAALAAVLLAGGCGHPPAAKPEAPPQAKTGTDTEPRPASIFLPSGASVMTGPEAAIASGGLGPSAEHWWAMVVDPSSGAASEADVQQGSVVNAVSNWFDAKAPKVYVVQHSYVPASWDLVTLDRRGTVVATRALDLGVKPSASAVDQPEVDVVAATAKGDVVALGWWMPSTWATTLALFDPRTGRRLPMAGPKLTQSHHSHSRAFWCTYWNSEGDLCYLDDGYLWRMDIRTGQKTKLAGPDVLGVCGGPQRKFAVGWASGPAGKVASALTGSSVSKLFLVGPDGKPTQLAWSGGSVSYAEADDTGKQVLVTSADGKKERRITDLGGGEPVVDVDELHAHRAYWLQPPKTAVLVGVWTIEKLDLATGKRTMLLDLSKHFGQRGKQPL